MKIDLPPQYDPKSVEKPVYQRWLEARVFHAVARGEGDARQAFSIVIPPPNVTGALHLGHAINGTIQDILTRYHRMKGDNTLWMPGIDHAGIATQAVVEKTIFEKEKKSRHDLGREELVRRIWEWKEQFGTRILSQLQSIGASCDWDRTRFTLDDICARAVREAFFKMFKDGLIFRGKRLVNWDTHLQTAVADDEIYHETVQGQMTSIKYPVDGSPDEYLIVATTRPETMLGDTAVAVHPDDERYKHLHGKHVIVPLVGRRIPIITDGLLVDPSFGTGVVKVTPAHDPNDYATGVRHSLEQINLLTPDGKVNEKGSGVFLGKQYSYAGLKFASAARKAVLADLEALGLIADVKPHEHEVGHSDRSKTPIEPYLSDQWFVRMGDYSDGITLADGAKKSGLAQAAMDAVTDGRVKITPDRYAKGYLDWLGQKRDWCISRQLWWGHRIPVWMFVWRGPVATSPSDSQQVKLELPYLTAEQNKQVAVQVIRPGEKGGEILIGFAVRPGYPEIEKLLEQNGGQQDPDVLDTWFSSALWPISTMGWPESHATSETRPSGSVAAKSNPRADAAKTLPHGRVSESSHSGGIPPEPGLLETFYPTSVLSTARDILTLWVARMVMFGLYCKGDVPFRDVYVHAVIQDGEGRTMSKSKGNGVDPVDIINSHGADALRFTLAQMATETQDIRMPVVKDAKTGANTSPKFDIGRNFANKIWNASRFILSNIDDQIALRGNARPELEKTLALEDRWILSRLAATIHTVASSINAFHFSEVATALYAFFWTDLCDWYLEIAKARIRAGDSTVQSILLHCLETSLKLLHPVMPFITEELWSKLPNRTSLLVTAPWPAADPAAADPAAETQIAIIQSITSQIRDIQNTYSAARGKPVVLAPRNAATQQAIEQSRLVIESLTGSPIAQNAVDAPKPPDAAARVLPDVQIFIGGVIDKAAETAKLTKLRDQLLKHITGSRNKLGNEAFVAKAPVAVVRGLRDQLAKQEEEFAAIEKNLAELQS
ncbi:MAG TPA: valine--tRNA ligase [Phycisphaerae bacterium]|nr:valine--tRNA ligase [Phycisphaerae bacterium]